MLLGFPMLKAVQQVGPRFKSTAMFACRCFGGRFFGFAWRTQTITSFATPEYRMITRWLNGSLILWQSELVRIVRELFDGLKFKNSAKLTTSLRFRNVDVGCTQLFSLQKRWTWVSYRIQVVPGWAGGRSFRRTRTMKQRKNLPIECAQGDEPVRCPNRVFCAHQRSAVPWWWCAVVVMWPVLMAWGCLQGEMK